MSSIEKLDMSKACDFKYEDYWKDANALRVMSQEDWRRWFSEHCGRCKYMGEVCMYTECMYDNK